MASQLKPTDLTTIEYFIGRDPSAFVTPPNELLALGSVFLCAKIHTINTNTKQKIQKIFGFLKKIPKFAANILNKNAMNKQPSGFYVSFRQRAYIERLTNDEAGELLKALIKYGEDGERTTFADRFLQLTYENMCANIDSLYKSKGWTVGAKESEVPAPVEPTIPVKPTTKPKVVFERPVKPEMWLDMKGTPEPLDEDLTISVDYFKKAN